MHDQKNIRKLQQIELNLAKKIISICEENQIKYIMLGGTMLGAIRHHGFIPWDDDIDFGMSRNDYDKFCQIVLELNDDNLKLLDFRFNNNHDYPAKVIDQSIELVNNNVASKETIYPWIDIFPLDGMPANKVLRKLHGTRLMMDRALLKLSQLSNGVALNNPYRTSLEKLIIKIGLLIRSDKFLKEQKMMQVLDRDLRKYSYSNCPFAVNFMGAYKLNEMFPRKIYDQLKSYSFEDTQFMGTVFYDEYLKQLYGNYMQPPKENDRDKHNVGMKQS
ncbi:MAG: LicD family protein [Liquorilactobacillus nagelii]|uniref:LicD family protein n=1 Tax=Liquorilactobacillus TaxID=2767888 RepID=UPI0039E89684